MSPILKQRETKDEEVVYMNLLKPGMYLYGYCCEYFGRDCPRERVIIAVTPEILEVKSDYSGRTVSEWVDMKGKSWKALVESSNRALETENE